MSKDYYPHKKILGVKFPFILGDDGNLLSLDDTYEVIKQNIILFFKTEMGSRIMRPNIGLTLRGRLGEPLTEEVRDRLSNEIQSQIKAFFPDVNIVDVNLTKPKELQFQVIIKYKIRNRINQLYPDEIKILIQ